MWGLGVVGMRAPIPRSLLGDDGVGEAYGLAGLWMWSRDPVLAAAWEVGFGVEVRHFGLWGMHKGGAGVPDDAVGEVDPLVAGDDAHEVLLDIARIVVLGEL